jgi:pimeloyl-ACP methyl ester carboxylesterase
VALLLHGFPESRFSWRHQIPFLAGRGWRAVAPDLRGYGDSARPGGREAYRIERLVEDAAALFDRLGARRRLLVGHDWGGVIAWAAAMRGVRLDGLVVMNAPHPARLGEVLRRSPAQMMRSWYVLCFQVPLLPEWLLTARGARAVGQAFRQAGLPDEAVARYRADAMRPGAARAMVDYYRANIAGLLRRTATPVIEVPTLLIWGEADVALGVELSERLERYVTDLTVERLPGVSHWVQQEVPEAVNARLARWLALKGLPSG